MIKRLSLLLALLTLPAFAGNVTTYPNVSSVQGTDLFFDWQSSAQQNATAAQIRAYMIGPGSINVVSGKTLTDDNTLTFSGTDGSTINVGSGGTVLFASNIGGSVEAWSAKLDALSGLSAPGTSGYVLSSTTGGTLSWVPQSGSSSITIGSNASGILTFSSNVLNFALPVNGDSGLVQLNSSGQLPTGLLGLYIGQSGGVDAYGAGSFGYVAPSPLSAAANITISRLGLNTAVVLTVQAGSGAYTANVLLSDSGFKAGDTASINVLWPTSANPTLNFYDGSTSGTLLSGPLLGTAAGGASTLFFAFDGTAWHHFSKGELDTRNLGTGVQTALGNNTGTASGFSTQSQADTRYAQLGAANTFTLNQTVQGTSPLIKLVDTGSGGHTYILESSGGTFSIQDYTIPQIDFSLSSTGNATFAGSLSAAGVTDTSTKTANTFLAGPSSGSSAAPAYRSLVQADLPAIVVNSPTPTYTGGGTYPIYTYQEPNSLVSLTSLPSTIVESQAFSETFYVWENKNGQPSQSCPLVHLGFVPAVVVAWTLVVPDLSGGSNDAAGDIVLQAGENTQAGASTQWPTSCVAGNPTYAANPYWTITWGTANITCAKGDTLVMCNSSAGTGGSQFTFTALAAVTSSATASVGAVLNQNSSSVPSTSDTYVYDQTTSTAYATTYVKNSATGSSSWPRDVLFPSLDGSGNWILNVMCRYNGDALCFRLLAE